MLPITYNEAIQFWTAEESPMKLSAYYELSVVFLEPEPPVTISGRVLAYGVNVFTEGAPQIIGSQNFITFKIPTVVETQELKAQPAQVAVGGTFSLLGTGFTGSPLDVVISNALLPKSCIVPLNDPNWKVELKGSNELSVKVYNTIDLPKEKPTDPTVSKDILPGLYAIQIRVSRRFKLPNGTERAVEHLSNQFPFTVTPRIDTVSPVAVGGKVTITGSVFKNTRLTEKDIQVYVGNDLYTLTSSGAAGTVDIQNPTTLVVTLLTGLKSKDYLPFRLIILGGESAPNWIQIP